MTFFPVCQTVRKLLGTLESVRQSMIGRVHTAIDASGGYFEHFLCVLRNNKT
jgi:hypothetical protein